MEKDQVIIYADGGCSPNPGAGGWAAILISPSRNSRTKEISGAKRNSTNNRMELTAAIMALKHLKRRCKVIIRTDSQYLQRAFTDGWLSRWVSNKWKTSAKNPVKNVDLWQELIALSAKHEISWEWIKGHAGDPHNERCDFLVSQARKKFINGD